MARFSDLFRLSPIILVFWSMFHTFKPDTGDAFRYDSASILEGQTASGIAEKSSWQSESHPENWEYITQSGDTLEIIATRFQVSLHDISNHANFPTDQLLDPGQVLHIQRSWLESPLINALLPDSEVVYSPSALGYSTQDTVAEAGGFLNNYKEYMRSTGLTPAADIIERVAIENSIHPRLLLAILEYQCGCLTGPLGEDMDPENLIGIQDPLRRGLYRQLGWTVNQLSAGYYGWRQGLLHSLRLVDGSVVQLPPDLNAGSTAVAYLFSRLVGSEEWHQAVGPGRDFIDLHQDLFPETLIPTGDAEPLFPGGLHQPEMILPFEADREWSFTSGPHPAWETDGANAALDFAPASERYGRDPSAAWVLAAADGLVVRSEHNALVLDLDGDGFEGTGWALLYMHLADFQRAEAGDFLSRGDPVGHPSCEGGPADGTHVHLARKFNGEWIAAGGPLPFVMGGWTAQAGYRPYAGSLQRDDQIVVANPLSPAAAFISRSKEDVWRETRISRDLWWEE